MLDHAQAHSRVSLYIRCTGHAGAVQVFEDLDFTLLEMNPFTLDSQGAPFPLDMRGELDDTAAFKSGLTPFVHLRLVTRHPLSRHHHHHHHCDHHHRRCRLALRAGQC